MADQPWMPKAPWGYWSDIENRKDALARFAKHKGWSKYEEWYQVTVDEVREFGIWSVLKQYGSSPIKMLRHLMPEHDWKPWLFAYSANGTWLNDDTVRDYLDWLGLRMGWKEPKDWYGLTRKILFDNHGGGLFNRFPSILSILKVRWPEFDWQEWRFERAAYKFWMSVVNQRQFLLALKDDLDFTSLDDFYRLTYEDVSNAGGGGIFQYYNHCIPDMVMTCFPEHKWDIHKFYNESTLEKIVRRHLDLRKIPYRMEFKFKNHVRKFRFDAVIRLSNKPVFIEAHGRQHYLPSSFGSKKSNAAIKGLYDSLGRDLAKERLLEENNFRLLIIPFWEKDNIPRILDELLAGREPQMTEPVPQIVKDYAWMREGDMLAVIRNRDANQDDQWKASQ